MGARWEWALLQYHRLPRSSLASPNTRSETSLYPQRIFSVNKRKESATHAGPSTGGSSLQPCCSPHLLLALGRGQTRWPSRALCVPGAFCGLHSGPGINPQRVASSRAPGPSQGAQLPQGTTQHPLPQAGGLWSALVPAPSPMPVSSGLGRAEALRGTRALERGSQMRVTLPSGSLPHGRA